MEITKNQEAIRKLYFDEYLTVKQIANRLQICNQNVYRQLAKLKKKGISRGCRKGGVENRGVAKTQGVENPTKFLRLHNIQDSLKILHPSDKYYKTLKQSNQLHIDGFTIQLYKDSIQIFTSKDLSFYAYSTDECYLQAIETFNLLYTKLENRLNIIINKEGYLNHKWVRQHIAECNNEIAEKANKDKKPIAYTAEDGKQWLITDNSFNLNELEFIHPNTAKENTDAVKRHLDAFRLNPSCPTNPELAINLNAVIGVQSQYGENIRLHLSTLKKMSDTLELIQSKL